MLLIINKFSFAYNERPQPMLFTVTIAEYSNDSHNRNTMHASCLTQFVFVTLNAFLTVWFVAVNRDILETKLKLINQLLIINELNFPPASILLYPL